MNQKQDQSLRRSMKRLSDEDERILKGDADLMKALSAARQQALGSRASRFRIYAPWGAVAAVALAIVILFPGWRASPNDSVFDPLLLEVDSDLVMEIDSYEHGLEFYNWAVNDDYSAG